MSTLAGAVAGFYGKLPARGDFVRAGLPTSFVSPWDDWLARVLLGSQQSLGEAWRAAWFEAPIWRFALSPGLCGPAAVLGLFLPSVDRAGRMYPLTLAAVVEGEDAQILAARGSDFLAGVERAGLQALDHDLEPDALAVLVRAAVDAAPGAAGPSPPGEVGATLWWTDGGPRVPPAAFAHPDLPGSDIFAWMLDTRPGAASQTDQGAMDNEAAR